MYTLGIDFKVEDIFRSFAFVVIRSDEALALESDAALGDHDAGLVFSGYANPAGAFALGRVVLGAGLC